MQTARVIVAEEDLTRLDHLKKYVPADAIVAGFVHADFNPNDYDLESWETVVDIEYTRIGDDDRPALSHENAKRFIVAGNATVTFVSPSGTRFTYRVRTPKKDEGDTRPPVHFVKVLTGSDNEADYTFLGTIFEGQKFVHSRKSRIGTDAPSAKAFTWAFPRIMADADLQGMQIFHEGKCGMCGRKLTVPESIESGLGPVCAGR
jgi:hypothetical protein